jgi:hypothetical protein
LEKHPEVWEGKVSLSEKRIEITQWVGRTWKWLHEEKLPIIIKGFRVVGLTLAVDGSEDKELAIKDMPDLKVGDWRLPGTRAAEDAEFYIPGDGMEKGEVVDEAGETDETQQAEVEVEINGNDGNEILPPTWDDKDCYQLTEDDCKYIAELEKGIADPPSDLESDEEDLSWYENSFGPDEEEANAVWHTAPPKRKRKAAGQTKKAKKARTGN